MPNGSDGEASDALFGALVTVLSVFVAALLALVCYLYFQLRQIHRQYKELLQESTITSTLSQRIREQRKSAISHMIAEEDLEQQRYQTISSPMSQRSGYSVYASECGGAGFFSNDITPTKPGSPETEPWAIRKVRSMERLTRLTKELSTRPERRDPCHDLATRTEDRNPFYDREIRVECDLNRASDSVQDGRSDKKGVSDAASAKATSLETVESEILHQQISESTQRTQASEPSLLAVPITISLTRSQSFRSPTTIDPQDLNRSSQSETNLPPHARSHTPQSPSDRPSSIADTIYLTSSDDSLLDDSLVLSDTDEVPRPFIERSFSLNLAFSDPETDTVASGRSSRGTKLKHYLKSARNNRRSLVGAAGRFSRRSPAAIIPKTKRAAVRLVKSNNRHNEPKGPTNEGVSQDKLATIEEF